LEAVPPNGGYFSPAPVINRIASSIRLIRATSNTQVETYHSTSARLASHRKKTIVRLAGTLQGANFRVPNNEDQEDAGQRQNGRRCVTITINPCIIMAARRQLVAQHIVCWQDQIVPCCPVRTEIIRDRDAPPAVDAAGIFLSSLLGTRKFAPAKFQLNEQCLFLGMPIGADVE